MTLWRIRATIDDRPGYLSVLTASLALKGVNILAVQVHTTEQGAVDDFLVDAPPALTESELLTAVERGRGRDCWITPAGARGLADEPTRVLALASRLVGDPDALGEALRGLLGATDVAWHPAGGPDDRCLRGGTMCLPDPTGGGFEITRGTPEFTPAEYARAQALVELAANLARRDADRTVLILPDGAELLIRPGDGNDLPALRAMHQRCSDRTRQQRYRGGAVRPGPAQLRRLLEPARGASLLAVTGGVDGTGERVVACATLHAEGAVAEASVLVEDRWQGRGVGSLLVRRLVNHADRAGYAALHAHVHTGNARMLRALDRLGRPVVRERDGDLWTLTMPLGNRRTDPSATGTSAAVDA